ncbi:MAG: hypothetical protein WAT39_01740 [Planctomycetota bacterium]
MLCALPLGLVIPTIWIVDAASGPGAHFTDLPPAIAAAQDGDTILVRAGTYSAVTITGKALAIRGAGAANTIVRSAVIGNVPGPGHLLLAGMRFGAGVPVVAGMPGVSITGPGQVVVLDCSLSGASLSGTPFTSAGPGLQVDGGAIVHAVRCSCVGGDAAGAFSIGGQGASVSASKLVAGACTFSGGDVTLLLSGIVAASAGDAVLVAAAGAADLSGCVCVGGSGTASGPTVAYGGDAVASLGAGSHVRVSGPATLWGGVGAGAPTLASGFAISANGGTAVLHGGVTLIPATTGARLVNGAVTMHPATMPRLTTQGSALPSGETNALQPFTMTFDAQLPNAPYAFVVGFGPDFASPFGPLVLGPLFVDLALAGLATGTLDTQGRFAFSLVPAAVFGSALGIPIFSQGAAFDVATLQFWTSNVDERIFAL